MDADEFLFRSLGVPGILTGRGRAEAAGARLRDAVGLVDPAVWPPQDKDVINMTLAVVQTVAASLRKGKLDPLLGHYGGEDMARVVTRVAADAVDASGFHRRFVAQSEPLVQAAINALLVYASDRPDIGWSEP